MGDSSPGIGNSALDEGRGQEHRCVETGTGKQLSGTFNSLGVYPDSDGVRRTERPHNPGGPSSFTFKLGT